MEKLKISTYYGSYLEGLLNMASSLSKSIGPSYIKVHGYEKNTFIEDFSKNYKIPKESIKLAETDKNLETTLLDWFYNENNIVKSIVYWFNIEIRGEKKVYLSDEKLVNTLDSKRRDFYSLDDMFFVECNEYIFVFLLGNNE